MARTSPPPTLRDLRNKVPSLRQSGTPPALLDRAKKLLAVYLDTAAAQKVADADVLRALADGSAALSIGGIELDMQAKSPPEPLTRAACRAGCAFCCILTGRDGGTITRAEAARLHTALAPLKGHPDGRAWHDKACPALDPETHMCRAYAARPMICRSYFSVDAGACEQNANGHPTPGAAILGAHQSYLTIHALARALLAGHAKVPTYSLATLAAAAVEGQEATTALRAARQPPRALDDERKRAAP
ncbi:YkgJ family cysteine cluster protein [Aestuariibius sp. 2305UL40-4]|uniref:YkgJ family cysteine cluster protein n=1 Tax=Aestuariibius violaceus TaxID=3234132 RepID=UPI00345E5AB4